VERKGADKGVIVGLGTAVAIRARFSGWLAIVQDASHRQHAARNNPRPKNRARCFIDSFIELREKAFRISANRPV
jgi:hypothetical protein